jgi:glutamate dehydrogenase
MSADSAIPAIDALAPAFAKALKTADLSEPEARFLAQMREDYLPEELPGVGPADLAANFADFWRWAATRKGAEPAIRIVPALGPMAASRLDILQTDSPFLVDSTMAEINAAAIGVRAMFHGVVDVARDAAGRRRPTGEMRRESMIQVMLEPLDAARADALAAELAATLADVRAAVGDYAAMRALVGQAIADIEAAPASVPAEAKAEYVAFLEWLRADHFVFLGARQYAYPRTPDGGYAPDEPLYQPQDSLGVLRDPARGVLRRDSEPAVLNARLRRHIEEDPPLLVAKANLRSRVHRRAQMDYVGVRRFGADGRPEGETRFVGLFTRSAYDDAAADVPLVRRKIAFARAHAGKTPGGHTDRRLGDILADYPRDELFQIGETDLLRIALGVVHLNDRPRVRLFARRDPFDRFVSLLLYVPTESFDAALVERAGARLAQAFDGRVSAVYPSVQAGPLARAHFIIGVTPGAHPEPDLDALEARVADMARTWRSRLGAALRADPALSPRAAELLARYRDAFPPGYRDLYRADEALADIAVIEQVRPDDAVRVRACRRADEPPQRLRVMLYRPGTAIPLASVLSILRDMGLEALVEREFAIAPAGAGFEVWTHEVVLDEADGAPLAFDQVRAPFEAAFLAVWNGQAESDNFNRLVLTMGIDWRQAALIRALARYRQQSGLDPSQAVQEAALRDHPQIAALILRLFAVKFDPASGLGRTARLEAAKPVEAEIAEALQAVESLEADRALRRIAAVVSAMVRTNFYQSDETGAPKPYIAFKIAARELADLPAPKPFREIFVASPQVEAAHLRFGPVARGGIRWSDRREDFRTEILGLAKAQQVKNAVIVPVGSKGGFYPKQLPRGGAPEQVQAEAIAAYRIFLSGLLDLTDNLTPDNQPIPPKEVVVLDDPDAYLVVAADKGTASFSDIANAIAQSRGYWLGDAFASGGSDGYDHKAMGITARGAWEAVKRHFRELGKDIQAEPFTVVGVGDMSGDVFGNGMLLSNQIRLVAAFDHRDVFVDPNPDPAASFAERQRLFALPRSSWADYDPRLISKGGGVFSRKLKAIRPTPEMQALLDLPDAPLTPAELISAILKARAELLYLGGIGTYVKAPGESHADVGDKANDAVRIDADDLRVQVVGEGANLGVTQAGRIAFARTGGRIDTDAIDNSAGVDTSDHEVNIKIATGLAERAGVLTRPRRDRLLEAMTDEVAAHVLAHNDGQTLALSLLERDAGHELVQQARFIAELESDGRLDRRVEGLPGAAALAGMADAGQRLTRPELAVLLAYGKLDLDQAILDSRAPDDPALEPLLFSYFPKPMRRLKDAIARHPLRRELIATLLSGQIVDVCGPTFARRLRSAADVDTGALVAGHQSAKAALEIDAVWASISALDGKIPADAQMALYAETAAVLRAATYWLARRGRKGAGPLIGKAIRRTGPGRVGSPIRQLIDAYRPPIRTLMEAGPEILSEVQRAAVDRQARRLVDLGAPAGLAHDVAFLRPLIAGPDIADLAKVSGRPVAAAARVYHQVGAAFGLDQMRDAARTLKSADEFERIALRRLVEDAFQQQAALTRAILKDTPKARSEADARAVVEAWAGEHADGSRAVKAAIAAVEAAGEAWSFAKLTLVNAALRELVAQAR